jgi:FtsH-binding integral membrane protein
MQEYIQARPQDEISSAAQRFIAKVYWWMFVALLTTGGVSYYTVSNRGILSALAAHPGTMMILIFAELGLVIALSAAINRLSASLATAMFFLYAALTGVTLSLVFAIYTSESLASTFLICAATFGATAFYGSVAKRDLTSVGNLAFMGLIGIIIASVVNMFFSSSSLFTAISYIGVVVFVGLTAYDSQKIKEMGVYFAEGSDAERKGAIIGALRLYLDFINLFLMLLRIFGRRR